MSYEGSSINPTVPPKSILYTVDGATVTGVVGFQYTASGQIYNSASTNYIQLNDNTPTTNLEVYSNSSILIQSQNETQLEVDSLVVNLTTLDNGGVGTAGQYLASDGNGHVIWQTTLAGLATIGTNTGSTNYYIQIPSTFPITTNAVVQTLLQVPDGVTQNWIVYAQPILSGGKQYILVSFSVPVTSALTTISWSVVLPTCTPTYVTTVPV